MLNLTLTYPHDANLFTKYGIEKYMKHMPLGRPIGSLCMYL